MKIYKIYLCKKQNRLKWWEYKKFKILIIINH